MAIALNTRTNIIVSVPNHYIGHPVLGKDLIPYVEGADLAPKKEKPKKFADYNSEATDGDLDGLVQDATTQERPVNTPFNIKKNKD